MSPKLRAMGLFREQSWFGGRFNTRLGIREPLIEFSVISAAYLDVKRLRGHSPWRDV